MKLYEAIQTIVQEFGKEIVTNAKVINVFSDYNAFEESKTFKVILKNLIAEGYMDQLIYVRDWANSQNRIINNFIAATSFNEANASYVINCLAYGLGYTKTVPVYSQSAPTQQMGTSSTPNYNTRAQSSSKIHQLLCKALSWIRRKANLRILVRTPNENTKRQQKLIWKVSSSSRVILKKTLE